jgi:CO/xanthine dehydrogenase FAD-binding subunit
MSGVRRYIKAASIEEALAAKRADPSASYLAGGTLLLAGDGRDKPEAVIDVGVALPKTVGREGGSWSIGAGASFQELAESKDLPPCLIEAALSMVNRNTRNRATVGGNLGSDKSCASLIPILIALGAMVDVVSPVHPESALKPERLELEAWLRTRALAGATEGPRAADLALRVVVPEGATTRAVYRRWNRVSCDLSVLGAAAAYGLEGGRVRNLRLVLGGLGPRARRFPEIEALFEGSPLPPREKIESAVSPLLKPIDDLRASAAFKRLRGAQLAADALCDAAATRGVPEERP